MSQLLRMLYDIGLRPRLPISLIGPCIQQEGVDDEDDDDDTSMEERNPEAGHVATVQPARDPRMDPSSPRFSLVLQLTFIRTAIFGHAAALRFFCPCIKHEGLDEDEDDEESHSMEERNPQVGHFATDQPAHGAGMDYDSRR
ncbi:hypothetical protein FB451DRAFT_1396330 [Mycena latifolia]|nr:hypothetical protein FB451DRAFT_1396330 [Mycena latifolia]